MTSIAFRRSLKLTADALQLMRTGSTLEKALSAACAQARPEEKAAVQSMLYSCARRAYLCEALIDQLAQRPPLPAVRNLLSAGLCALCDFPQKSYAILNEAVTAAKADPETAPAAGFINACLRRFTREAEKLTDFVNRDPCVRFNAPRWWIERLDREFGRAAADEILAVQKKKPPLTVRVNRRRTTVSAWCETARSQGLTVAAVENEAVVINEAVPVGKIPGFNEGLVSIQDAGAQLAAHLLAPENGDRRLKSIPCAPAESRKIWTDSVLRPKSAPLTPLTPPPGGISAPLTAYCLMPRAPQAASSGVTPTLCFREPRKTSLRWQSNSIGFLKHCGRA